MIALLLTRWRAGLSIVAVLLVVSLFAAAQHYRKAYHTARDGRVADRAAYTAAQVEAGRIARAALQHQEAVYAAKAKDADHAYSIAIADARTAADRYISAHRVRTQAVGGASIGTVASTASDGASVPAGMPTNGVVVTEADVHACTDAVIYARDAHDWAVTLEN